MEYHFLNYDYYDIGQNEIVGLNERISGNNKKRLLILITEEDAEDDKAKNQLKAILAAIKYDMNEDCCMLNFKQKECVQFQNLPISNFDNLISFGISSNNLGLQIKQTNYTALNVLNKTLLFADPISTITDDVAKKKRLWAALQEIFI